MFEKFVKAVQVDYSPAGLGVTLIGTIGVALITTVVKNTTEHLAQKALKKRIDENPDYLVQLYTEDQKPILIGKI